MLSFTFIVGLLRPSYPACQGKAKGRASVSRRTRPYALLSTVNCRLLDLIPATTDSHRHRSLRLFRFTSNENRRDYVEYARAQLPNSLVVLAEPAFPGCFHKLRL